MSSLMEEYRVNEAAQSFVNIAENWTSTHSSLILQLAASHEDDYHTTNNLESLDKAISLYAPLPMIIQLSPSPDRRLLSEAHLKLGNAHLLRYTDTGEPSSLEDSIRAFSDALGGGELSSEERSDALSSLGFLLAIRARTSGDRTSSAEGIRLQKEAIGVGFDTLSESSSSTTHTPFLLDTFAHDDSALEQIKRCREELVLCPVGHEDRPSALVALGGLLTMHGLKTGNVHMLKDSLPYLEEAADIIPEDDSQHFFVLSMIAIARKNLQRFEGDKTTLEDTVAVAIEALAVGDEDHPEQFTNYLSLFDLVSDFGTEFHTMLSFDFLQNAILHAPMSPVERLSAVTQHYLPKAVKLATSPSLSSTTAVQERLLDLYRHLIDLLPRVAYLGLDLDSRFEKLSSYTTLGIDAAILALSLSHPDQAVELLEQSRAVFWTQALRLRVPLDGIPDSLRSRLKVVLGYLESGSFTERKDIISPSSPTWNNDTSITLRRATDHAEDMIAQVRDIPGCERFLLSQPSSALAQASKSGPVVMLLANQDSREAIVFPDPSFTTPLRVPLSVTLTTLNRLSDLARNGTLRSRDTVNAERAGRPSGHRPSSAVVLNEVWRKIVGPILAALGFQKRKGRERPRLFWCPTGPFTHIPLHAAGVSGNCTSDYVVSSYTPTISALLQAQNKPRVFPKDQCKALLVAEADAPGLPRIDDVVREIEGIKATLSSTSPTIVGDLDLDCHSGGGATTEVVIDNLPGVSILHLACHGQVNKKNPLESGFCLHDGNLTISQLMQANLSNASLAFLSACETAKGSSAQPDQAIHLAAAMLFVGFPSVIGTMWTMGDIDGPTVSKLLYEEVMKDDTVNLDDVPYALDAATQTLRDNGVNPERWATFIHMGL